jgi:hypothetical protein
MKRLALVAAALMLVMILIYVFTGIGQEPLQRFQAPDKYVQTLLQNPSTLKAVIGFDNAFVLFYGTCFLLLGVRLMKKTEHLTIVVTSIGLLMATAILDLFENLHYLTLISMAQAAVPIGAGEIEFQVWESLVKFHVSYVGLFLLGFVLPTSTAALRSLAFLLLYVQWPVGILIYVGPDTWVRPLVILRFSFFLTGLLILALTDWRKTDGIAADMTAATRS